MRGPSIKSDPEREWSEGEGLWIHPRPLPSVHKCFFLTIILKTPQGIHCLGHWGFSLNLLMVGILLFIPPLSPKALFQITSTQYVFIKLFLITCVCFTNPSPPTHTHTFYLLIWDSFSIEQMDKPMVVSFWEAERDWTLEKHSVLSHMNLSRITNCPTEWHV